MEAMNVALIDRWNETVGPDDDVMIVGDLALGKIADTLPLVPLLNGKKKLVLGNHDRPFGLSGSDIPKKQRQWERWSKEYQDVGLELIDGWFDIELGVEGSCRTRQVRVCHFPYTGDSHSEHDRYDTERPPNDGHILIHGHVHDAWQVLDRMINVGVDVWDYRPVPETHLLRLIEEIH